jgi:hypothetical protein
MLEYIARTDVEGVRVRKETNNLFKPVGLDFFNPPTEAFRKVANQSVGVIQCRIVNTLHMMRIYYCTMANKNLEIILNGPRLTDQAARDGWLDLKKTLEKTARLEADLILGSLPFYIPPDQSLLSPTDVSSLVWPLSTFVASPLLTKEQHAAAKEALLQIGARAAIPVATKLASAEFAADAKLSEEVHLIHLSWYF